MKLLIVGWSQAGHMGSYLASAARQLKFNYEVMDASKAEATSRFGQSFNWRFRGKRPGRLGQFGEQLLERCAQMRPDLVITTGRAPVARSNLERIRLLGGKIVNYSTDDPWNPKLRAPWFLSALPLYDSIFTTRRANIDDFKRCGARAVHFLPFGYDPEVHRPWPEGLLSSASSSAPSDVMFVGGCDVDRLPLIGALVDAGFDLGLFGGYWNRHFKTKRYWRGLADQDAIRAASAAARICLCLVRRANRDGSVMRSFEAAAIGGCILAEDTSDHRELFGEDARYFGTIEELVAQARSLVADEALRNRLTAKLRARMSRLSHTYADRLSAIVNLSGFERSLKGQPAAAS